MGVPPGHDQTETCSMTALSSLRRKARVPRIRCPNLAHHQLQGGELQITVGLIEQLQLVVQVLQPHLLGLVPLLVCDLAPEQAAKSILEGTKVSSMHRVDAHMSEDKSRAAEEVGRLSPLSHQGAKVLSMGNQGGSVRGLPCEVGVPHRSRLGGVTHPTKPIATRTPKPEALHHPFPVTPDLQECSMGKRDVCWQPVREVMVGPWSSIVAARRGLTREHASHAPCEDVKQLIERVEASATTVAELLLADKEEEMPLASEPLSLAGHHIDGTHDDRPRSAGTESRGVGHTVSMQTQNAHMRG